MAEDFKLQPAKEQVALSEAPFHTWTLPNGASWTEFHRVGHAYLLRFPELADFEVLSETLTVICHPVPGVSKHSVEHLYLNQVLPLVLSKKGELVFHASAVEIDSLAVAFVGESGRGKSTLAASFAVARHPFLTDDGLVLQGDKNGFNVLPSHPSIRLWEDSENALITPGVRRAPPVHYTSKARLLADNELVFCEHPSPLRRVYFLGEDTSDAISIHPISAADAMIEWVKHSFLLDIEEHPRVASHFDQVSDLANQPIHYRLDYPRSFAKLGQVQNAIIQHVHESGEGL